MKKTISVIFLFIMMLSLAACGANAPSSSSNSPPPNIPSSSQVDANQESETPSADVPVQSQDSSTPDDFSYPNVSRPIPEILRITIGTLDNSYETVAMVVDDPYPQGIYLEFSNTTEAEYNDLISRFSAESAEVGDDGFMLFDWGKVLITPSADFSRITVQAAFKA